ncbi:protein SNORC-like [Oncorhynchus nerka]|uniref:protein SNORC n=1 Tax=Oncorhynchus mykiss TaxID=8022 RepID=UPI000B4F9554|nr:protein SNORC [Oncorhynchus mykiss]XP_024247549.1 protein SNORC-like [Oncorhynchus tshawytscha]XP_029477125.1 protein SNORC-like [Oncorhynchus nerka]
MANCSSVSRLVLLVLLGLWVATIHSETVEDPTPTLQGDNQDTLSGGGTYDVTTKDPFKDMTERVLTFEYEDTTHSQVMDEEEGVLGPGAITAIVIAVFLGASVLLALIVITLRKFTAS